MEGHPALPWHQRFAFATTAIFLIVAIYYALIWYARYRAESGIILKSRFVKLAQWVVNGKAVILLAILGFISVTITGGLGGAMVYGPDADPFFKPIYNFIIGK